MSNRTSNQPRHTAQAHALRDLIGQTVTMQVFTFKTTPGDICVQPDPRHVRVRVLDTATPYGAARLLVEPVTGTGQAWVSADKLIAPTDGHPAPIAPRDPGVVTVVNLATGDELIYTGLTPQAAVTAAAEAAAGNHNTWTYAECEHLATVSISGQTVSRGDFAALIRIDRRALTQEAGQL